MKRWSLLLLLSLSLCYSYTVSFAGGEYFFDTDPGYGAGIAFACAGDDSTLVNLSINKDSLGVGAHILGVRTLNSDGAWSETALYDFVNARPDYISIPPDPSPSTVTDGEWFLDTDPGIGLGTAFLCTPGDSVLANLGFSYNDFTPGEHRLGFRMRNENGDWSEVAMHTFVVADTATVEIPPDPSPSTVTKGEWFVDADPGCGLGTAFACAPGDSVLANLSFSYDDFAPGEHRLGFRMRNENGAWSEAALHTFVVPDTVFIVVPPDPAPAQLAQCEFFIDSDPGLGQGYPVTIPTSDSLATSLQFDKSAYAPGAHVLGFRIANDDGGWSETALYDFVVPIAEAVVIPPDPQPAMLQAGEYFFDADPGFGSGYAFWCDPADDVSLTIGIPEDTLATGGHVLGVRMLNDEGLWSETAIWAFTIGDTTSVEVPPDPDPALIVGGEWFLDADPGYGFGTTFDVTDTDDLDVTLNLEEYGLSSGQHTLGVRLQNADGCWSETALHSFSIEDSVYVVVPPDPPAPGLASGEWFVDADPGLGLGTPFETERTDTATANIQINKDLYATGAHILGFRMCNESGGWSETALTTFVVQSDSFVVVAPDPAPAVIIGGEYFIDSDPGLGAGIWFNAVAGDDVACNISFERDIYGEGAHICGFRTMNADSVWSETALQTFVIPRTDYVVVPPDPSPALIDQVAVYVSDSLGVYGPFHYDSFTPSDNIDESFQLDLTGYTIQHPAYTHARVLRSDGSHSAQAFKLNGINGSVEGVWDSPVWVNGDITLASGSSLMVTQNAAVFLWQDVDFDAQGSLSILGTDESPVPISGVGGYQNWGGLTISDPSGDVVLENVQLSGTSQPLTIEGSQASRSRISINRLTLTAPANTSHAGITVSHPDVVITNADIFGFGVGIEALSGNNRLTVRNTRVRPNARGRSIIPDSLIATTGIHISDCPDVTLDSVDVAGYSQLIHIENSAVALSDVMASSLFGNELIGFHLDGCSGTLTDNQSLDVPVAFSLTSCDSLSLLRNALRGADGEFSIGVETEQSYITVDRMTACGFGRAFHVPLGSSIAIENSIVRGNNLLKTGLGAISFDWCNSEIQLPGSENTTWNPQFVNYPQGDYNLGVASPAIDAGNLLSDPDPDYSRADLGAYPFTHPVTLDRGDIEFGTAQVGETVWRTFTIINTTAQPIADITFEHEYAALDSVFVPLGAPWSVAANDTLLVTVGFCPQDDVFYYDRLHLTYDTGKSLIVSLYGQGSQSGGTLAAPANLTIEYSTPNVLLHWTPVENATAYNVYRCENLPGGEAWELILQTSETQCALPVTTEHAYFYVTALDEETVRTHSVSDMSRLKQRTP